MIGIANGRPSKVSHAKSKDRTTSWQRQDRTEIRISLVLGRVMIDLDQLNRLSLFFCISSKISKLLLRRLVSCEWVGSSDFDGEPTGNARDTWLYPKSSKWLKFVSSPLSVITNHVFNWLISFKSGSIMRAFLNSVHLLSDKARNQGRGVYTCKS